MKEVYTNLIKVYTKKVILEKQDYMVEAEYQKMILKWIHMEI